MSTAPLRERLRRPFVALLVGFAAAVAVGVAAARAFGPVPELLYDPLYLPLGPSAAIQVATRATGLGIAAVAVTAVSLLAIRLDDRRIRARLVAAILGGQLLLAAGLLAASLVGLPALPAALAVLLASPVALTQWADVDREAMAAFLGGTGGVAVLLVLGTVFVPLVWGEGFLLVASELDPANVSEDASVVDFEAVPEVRDDLFATHCETGRTWKRAGRETCRFRFWHYEHERSAVRYLADHGVRCPYGSREGGSLLARYDGSYYRVTCGRAVD